jgi:hypothetical protein
VSELFEGIDTGPFLGAVKSFFSIFSQANPSGQALKAGITPVFDSIFATLGKVVTAMRHFFLDLIIWGLKGYIALKPMISAVQDFSQRFHVLEGLMLVGKGLLVSVAAAATIFLGPFVLAAAAIAAVVAGLGLLLGAIASFVPRALAALGGWAKSGAQMAEDFISGLVGGLVGGVSKAVDAVKSLGSSILGGVKGVLGIHSPSVEMQKLGLNTGQGFAMGVEASAPAAQVAMTSLAAPAPAESGVDAGMRAATQAPSQGAPGAAGAPGRGGAGGAGARGGNSFVLNFNIDGSKDPKAAAQETLDTFTDWLEQMGLQMGGAQT